MTKKCLLWLSVFVCALALPVASVPHRAHAAGDACVMALTKSIPKYVSQRWKAISKCEQLKADGKIPDTENCRPADGAVTDAKTANLLAKAADKLNKQLSKKCTGALPPLGPACDSATDVASLVACVTAPSQDADNVPANADALVAAIYPSAGTMDSSCLKKISKSAGSFLKKRLSSMSKCQLLREKGKITEACPDAKVLADSTKSLEKFEKKVLAGCSMLAVSSPDLVFGEPCDLATAAVYNRAAGGSVNNTIPPLLRFMRCVTDFAATVADHANVLGNPQPPTTAFTEGVAAGDATDTAVVFWTRVPDPNSPATLEVATDPAFGTIVHTSSATPASGADGTVKIDVGGLTPATTYYYRFTQGTDTSPVGRVKTAPSPTD
ncbi:MAG: hypothetical protein D6760_05765, partial [Deltaproteobacteria bacterium]